MGWKINVINVNGVERKRSEKKGRRREVEGGEFQDFFFQSYYELHARYKFPGYAYANF